MHERQGREELLRLAGWWGHEEESRFEMPAEFRPMKGAEGWQLSNPSIMSLSAVRAALDIFHGRRNGSAAGQEASR